MTSRSARLPIGMLGAVALVAAVEMAVALREMETVSPDGWQYRFASRTAAVEAVDCEILAFGDSLLKFAFLPAVLERKHGVRSYNMAACNAGAPYHYYLLRRALEGGARPSAILLECFPGSLANSPRINAGQLPYLLRASECLELGIAARDAELLGRLLAGWLLPSLSGREAIRDDIVKLVTRRLGGTRYENSWLLPWWSKNRGAMVMHDQPEPPGFAGHTQQVAFPASWSSAPVNDHYIDRFLKLAAQRGTTVYWVLTPLSPPLQAECERSGFDARYEAYVKAWQQRYPNLKVIDGRHAEYDPSVYYNDPAHLGRTGAFVFSVDIGELLAREGVGRGFEGERWVALPRFRHLTPDIDIEDDLAARRAAMESGRRVATGAGRAVK